MSARILMVDQYDFVRETFAAYLDSRGFEVRTARRAEEALKTLRTWAPDLIITDIDLPGMGGAGFLRQIASERGRPRYPVLIFTGEPGMDEFCRGLRVQGFLHKSVYGGELVRKIREILETKSAVAEVEAMPVRRRVLLAEDDAPIAESIRHAFETAGFEVDVVADGPSVLERARELKHDVIVMKEVLSGMNGSVAAASLKSTGKTREVPIILYDQAPLFGDHRFQSKLPDGVSAFVPSIEAALLLREFARVVGEGADGRRP